MSAKLSPESRLSISVAPQIELLSVVLKLSGYGERYAGRINDIPSRYLSVVQTYFRPYAAHAAVAYFQDSNAHVSGDLPVAIAVHLAEPPGLALRAPFNATLQARAGDAARLDRYVGALRQFAQDTDFMAFFRSQQGYYEQITAVPQHSIRQSNHIATLEAYFGARQRSYHVVFAPLLKTVAFGPRVPGQQGELDTYCIFPAVAVENDIIQFKEGGGLHNAILHEFAHSFINPLVDAHKETLDEYARLMDAIRYETNANYGLEWHICVYEHLVRAVTTRLTSAAYGPDEGEKEMAGHIRQGFIYLPELCDRLTQYEHHRQTYPTFSEFFPALIDVFAQLSTRKERL